MLKEVKNNSGTGFGHREWCLAGGGGICAGSKAKTYAKYAQNMRKNMCKYAQKYAQNMRYPKNGVGSATPYLITHGLLLQNMMIF